LPAPLAHGIADTGWFDLDRLGAVIGEEVTAEGSADDVTHLEDPNARQRTQQIVTGQTATGSSLLVALHARATVGRDTKPV
jgi:hypothetical protein